MSDIHEQFSIVCFNDINIQLKKTVLLIYSHTWIKSISSCNWDFGTWLLTQAKFLLSNMHINICKTKILFGSLAVEVNHRSHQNPLLPYSGIYLLSSLSSLFFFLHFFSLCLIILLTLPFPFSSTPNFIYPSSSIFFQLPLLQKGGKIYLQVWKKLNTIEKNCQFQFTTHNEAQQEKVSQVERSVKHSKIAQIR